MDTMASFPIGSIILWASTQNIPAGWSVCNGQNGTPNLEERFPIGTTNSAKIGQIVGAPDHAHSVTGSTTVPDNGSPNGTPLAFETQGQHKFIHTHSINGQTNTVSNLPPSTYVIFIMKTSNIGH
jgi:hypothetical protein